MEKLLAKFSNSRDFTISVILHLILIVVFSSVMIVQTTKPPADFTGGGQFVEPRSAEVPLPPRAESATTLPTYNPANTSTPNNLSQLRILTTPNIQPYSVPVSNVMAPQGTAPTTPNRGSITPAPGMSTERLTSAEAAAIKIFTDSWGKDDGSGRGLKEREFKFTAYIGKYRGGNWDSTVKVVKDKIVTGSLPNLLYLMSAWSKDKINTNYKDVEAIQLDSDSLFTTKPPFIFFTGTKDFILSDKEVENLRKYIRLGGCIWGDSSLPGLRSRFDIAFRREMKRVIPDIDKDFEPLPANHPIFTQTYFTDVKVVPPGLNFYQEPIMALKMHGEIAILYTANDYGDMWQTGLDRDGNIDMRRTRTDALLQ